MTYSPPFFCLAIHYSRCPNETEKTIPDNLAQLSQLSIEIGTFDSARAVSFHHKAGRLADGCIPWAVVASAISP